MPLLFWDASALVKRYMPETGRDTVNLLFEYDPLPEMAATSWGYLETYSILVRHQNGGVIDRPTLSTAIIAIQAEVLAGPNFNLLPISDASVFAAANIVRKHNLNATDAAILMTLLTFVRESTTTDVVLVASDKRLIRAAISEGLKTLDPAGLAPNDVPAFIASI